MGIAITPKIQYVRDENGVAALKVQTDRKVEIKGLGIVSGNGMIKFGATDPTNNYTQVTYEAEKDEENELILANNNGLHINVTGENANVKCAGGNAERTLQIDAVNSSIDLSRAAGSQAVVVTENTHDNKIKLGTGRDNYLDEGKFNQAIDKGGANTFITSKTSHGSVIVGGAGNDTFLISGQYGVINGGAGHDTFKTNGVFGEHEDSSYRNIIIGGLGDDVFEDKGGNNLFIGGGGTDSATLAGSNAIVDLTQNTGDTTGTYTSSSIESMIFVDENRTHNGNVFNLYQAMKNRGWTLEQFIKASAISPSNPESIADHNAIDSATWIILNNYFDNVLSKLEKLN